MPTACGAEYERNKKYNRGFIMKDDHIKFAATALLAATLCAFALAFPTSARAHAADYDDTRPYNWYVNRTKDHSQPPLGSDLAFIENCGGYYVDKDADDSDKVLYLTFDAGYENGNIARILDVMRDKGATGAFFILGNMVERFPDLVMRMKNEGHLVCNHTYSHNDMSTVTDEAEFKNELAKMADAYKSLTGEEMARYYRPPEGRFSKRNLDCALGCGYKTIFWSFAYADWDNNKQPSREFAMKKILDNTHNGAVILLHPTSKTNADILGDLIDKWRADGYRFGTLDELCGG